MRRFKFRAWSVVLTLVMIMATLAPTAMAQSAPVPLSDDEAIVMLQAFGIVKGDERGNLHLDEYITRAQAAAIFVRSLGKESLAQLLKDSAEFNDTAGHWAAGEIAMAKRLGLMQGDGTNFRPNDNITYAELMTVMLRMIGREPVGPWDPVRIMQTAAELGIAPAAFDVALLANVPAVRGKVFTSLAITITTPLADGTTLLQQYHDQEPPVLTVDELPERPASDKVTVTGQAQGARMVLVNGEAATMSGTRFTAQVALEGGVNEIVVEAVDYAGNKASETLTIALGGDPVRIEVIGPTDVDRNESITVTATAYDADGYALPASAIKAEVVGGIGTYDVETGVFTAGGAGGVGSIKFTAGDAAAEHTIIVTGVAANASGLRIVAPEALTMGKANTVTVEVVGADGAAIGYDTGRRVTLSASSSSVTISPTAAHTKAGKASFTVTPGEAGEFTLTASSAGLAVAQAHVTAATTTRIVLTATPSTLTANGSDATIIQATLQDENGNPVVNDTGSDITLSLSSEGVAGAVVNSFVMIPRGRSNSAGYDGQFVAAYEHGTVTINGVITSDHDFTVVGARVTLNQLVIGRASRIEVLGGGGIKQPDDVVELTLRVTDVNGNPIPDGSYAFQVKVDTTNPEDYEDTDGNGLPDGVTLSMGMISPVAGSDVVARTVDGTARITVSYDKSGIVTVTPVGVGSTQEAYDADGNPDSASSTINWQMVERELTYDDLSATGRTGIELVWEVPHLKLTEQDVAILPADGSTSAKLYAYIVDDNGGRHPSGSGTMTIDTSALTGVRTSSTATVKDGVAVFTVIANRDVDAEDLIAVTHDALTSAVPARVQVRSAKANPPTIWSVYSESGNTERIEISDTYLELLLTDVPVGDYGIVKVYTSRNRLVYTSDVIQFTDWTSIQVPKDALPVGSESYKVTVNTGYGDSAYSALSPTIVNAQPLKADITSVRYDASGLLKVYASGVSTSYGGEINEQYLFLTDGSQLIPLGGTDCTLYSGYFTCDLSGYQFTTDNFSGSWYLDTEGGWFVRTTRGDSAVADENTSNNYVTPLASLTYAALDLAGGKITLYGVNLNKGYIYPAKIKVGPDKTSAVPLSTSSTSRVSSNRADQVTITISTTVLDDLEAIAGSGLNVYADKGWLTASTGEANLELKTPAAVLAAVSVSWVSYTPSDGQGGGGILTIYGKGLDGGQVNLADLVIKNRSGTEVYTFGAGDQVLNLDTDTNTYIVGDKIEIQLANPSTLEAGSNNRNVYLSSTTPTSADGYTTSWFTDANGMPATGVREFTYLLSW